MPLGAVQVCCATVWACLFFFFLSLFFGCSRVLSCQVTSPPWPLFSCLPHICTLGISQPGVWNQSVACLWPYTAPTVAPSVADTHTCTSVFTYSYLWLTFVTCLWQQKVHTFSSCHFAPFLPPFFIIFLVSKWQGKIIEAWCQLFWLYED